jgi:hypothetical protein
MTIGHLPGASTGNDADDGSTWALGKATMLSASGIAGTGNLIYADAAGAETRAGSETIAGGTPTDPMRWISGTPDATTGLTAISKGYAYTNSGGTYSATFGGSSSFEGFVFTMGTGTNNASLLLAQNGGCRQSFKDCDFILAGSSSSARITVGLSSSSDGMRADWHNCGVKFASVSQYINVQNAELNWEGGSVLAGGSTPNYLFGPGSPAGRHAKITVTGVNLSNLGTGFSFIGSGPAGQFDLLVRGCKLPASWSGSLVAAAGANNPNFRALMIDCDDDNAGFVRFRLEADQGVAEQETTIMRTGSGDGIADYSIKVTGTSRAKFPGHPFVIHEQAFWNDDTGGSKTLTIELAAGSALTNQQIVARARYYGDAASPKMSVVTSQASQIASAAALTSSSATWNGSPSNKYKIELTFTPEREGYIVWEILSFTTTPVYVDPLPVLA